MYFRALKTESRIELIYGKFDSRHTWLPAYPWKYKKDGHTYMRHVHQAREKGTDVNLASHLVRDSLRGYADAYIVMTNDSDQVKPLEMLKNENVGILGVIVPAKFPSKALMNLDLPVSKQIREGVLIASQFPEKLFDKKGQITKPKTW
jgi:NYN domain